jgi:pimeloyl-ACP methyl ester carboxylesterase
MALDLPLAVETHGPPAGPGVETFLLLHGFGGSAFSWRYWTGPLARRGHVVLVDLKGFGSAPKPDDDAYGPHEQADLVDRLIVQRDLGNLTLVGHSLGGGIALLLALRLLDRHPQRLRRLVLLAGAAYRQELPPFVRFARWPRLSAFLLRLLGARFVVRKVLKRIVYDPTRVTRSQVEGYAEPMASGESRRALIRAGGVVLPHDLDEIVSRYPSITVPTLLLWGRQDPVVPLWVGERLAAALPDARLEVLDECGHLPAEERPEDSLLALERFVDGTRATP